MKQRPQSPTPPQASADLDALASALCGLKSAADVRAFLEDLCTPSELESMSDRWKVVPLILQGETYRDIHDQTGVSVTTVGRVARTLELGSGGYRKAAAKAHRHPG